MVKKSRLVNSLIINCVIIMCFLSKLTNKNLIIENVFLFLTQLGGTWMRIFILLGLLALLLNLVAFCVVRDRPHTPPSLAQYKLEVQRRMTGPTMDKTKTKDFINSVEHVASTLKSVFLDPVFVGE